MNEDILWEDTIGPKRYRVTQRNDNRMYLWVNDTAAQIVEKGQCVKIKSYSNYKIAPEAMKVFLQLVSEWI